MVRSTRAVTTQRINSSSFLRNRNVVTIPIRDLVTINKNIVKIKSLVKTSSLLSSRQYQRERILREGSYYNQRERELEANRSTTPKYFEDRKIDINKPKFFDTIENYFVSILFGMIGMKLVSQINKLPAIVSGIGNAIDFASSLFVGLFDGLATFVEKGYEAYDFTRKLVKSIGGENTAKLFDGFNSALGNIVTAAIASAFALADIGRQSGGGGFGGESPTPRRGFDVTGRRVNIDIQRRYLARFGEQQFERRFGGKALRRILETGAEKTIERGFLRAAVSKIPFIGALLDFGISVALGESPGRAAFRAIGASILGAVGGAILGAIGTAGGPLALVGAALGSIAGSALGDVIGGALYDMFFGGKTPKTPNNPAGVKAATGGQISITRGGKPLGGRASKPLGKPKVTRSLKVQPTKLKPGQSVGGEEKIKKLFPDTGSDKKSVNPYEYITSSYSKISTAPGLGGILALGLKAQVGEKPSDIDYQNAAEGLLAWNQRTFSTGVTRFANGGEVLNGSFADNSDAKQIIARSLKDSLFSMFDNMFTLLKKQLGLKEIEHKGKKEEQPSQTGGEYTGLPAQAKEIYDYLVSKGMNPNAAMGILLNAQRESALNYSDFHIDVNNVPVGGLLQWNGGRFTALEKAVPDWKTNWKGQIDYIFREAGQTDLVRTYMSTQFNTALDAANWWMEKWERPADPAADRIKHQRIYEQWVSGGLTQAQSGQFQFDGSLGAVPGNLSEAQSLASTFGLQLTSHYRRGDPGYHGQGRAMDFSNGINTPQQMAFAREMIKRYGRSLKQLIYTPLGFGISDGAVVPLSYWGEATNRRHYNHVHVAFAKGGRVRKPMYALIGEKGPEFIFDADTTSSIDRAAPGLLELLNAAKTKKEIDSILSSYASYEDGAEQIVVITQDPEVVPVPIPVQSGFGGMSFTTHNSSDSYDALSHGH